MKEAIKNALEEIVGQDAVLVNEPMEKHTTFRVGGPADYFVCPSDTEQVQKVLKFCRESETPYFILGKGSNLLVSDEGFRGVILQIGKNMSRIEREGNRIWAQAGTPLAIFAKEAADGGLTGAEFAAGIPGTLGGAVVMNAGAYGGEMKDILKEVTVVSQEGELIRIPAQKLEMGYRTSIVKKAGYIVLEATAELEPGKEEEIRARMKELADLRVQKQPLDYPSAGSTFKRPEGHFAGKLIMDAGLRGYRVGNAQVSEKHCGFVINLGGATAKDVYQLMQDVGRIVKEKYQIELEPEVKMLGKF